MTLGASSTAFAAKCKDVEIKVKNERAQEIKVYRAKYWDTEAEKWRTEDFSAWKLAPSTKEKKVRNLEKRKVSLTGKYRQRKRGNVLERSHPVFRHCQKFWRFR